MTVLGIIIGLLVLFILVALHELGHAWVAHRSGVKVEEYAIGFPPNLWTKKLKSGIDFKINALPIGGYVKLQGEYDAANKPGDYGRASYANKTKILIAGVAVNFALAWLILSVLGVVGMPVVLGNQFKFADDSLITSPVRVSGLEKDGPAERAGLKVGDEILSLAGQTIDAPERLSQLTTEYAGREVPIIVKNGGAERSLKLTLRGTDKPEDQGFAGVYPAQQCCIKTSWYKAPVFGAATAAQLGWETFKGVGQLFVDFFGGIIQKISFDPSVRQRGSESLSRAGDSVAGPIALLGIIFPSLIESDVTTFWFFVALISLTLTVMNLLPIPGLDGGRWLTLTIFRLTKQKLTKQREEKIQAVGTLILLSIMVLVVISDVFKII